MPALPPLAQAKAYADVKIRIVGHTDNVGIVAERMTTDGRGDSQPVADNATAEGRAMNRRVEFEKL